MRYSLSVSCIKFIISSRGTDWYPNPEIAPSYAIYSFKKDVSRVSFKKTPLDALNESTYKSEPKRVTTSPWITPESKVKHEAEKIRNEIASVNMIDVLLLRLRWLSRFLLMTYLSFLSRLQHVIINKAKNPFSTNSKTRTDKKVRPIIINTSSASKISKNHFVRLYQNVRGTQ